MSKRVQLLGHIAEIANTFVGYLRELTVDVDQAELRLHDGVTEGGRRFLDRDANDNRYQTRSVELDGLLGWEPNERGFTVRIGPSNYRLRQIAVDMDNMTVENPFGYLGNPIVGLKEVIESSHTFAGEITFEQTIIGLNGFSGNLDGDTSGTHLGNVIGNVTGDLTGNANGDHTGSFTGDGNFSDSGVLFADEQLLLEWLHPDAVSAWTQGATPVSGIIAYAGNLLDLPANWFVCDGTNGTPDLRDRFILGAGTTPAHSAGGSTSHSHAVTIDSGGAHSHTGTVGDTSLSIAQMPSHRHANGVTDAGTALFSRGSTAAATVTSDSIDNNSNNGTNEGWTETVGSGNPHNHGLTIDTGGSHTHTGGTAAISHIPPYYALVYIMRGS